MNREKKFELIANEIRLWSSEILEVSSPAFGGMPPCPYAQKTWQNNQFAIHFCDNLDVIVELKAILNPQDLVTHICVWLNPEETSVVQFDRWIEGQNKNHFGIWMMGFHPDADDNEMTDEFEGLVEDDYGLILVQSLDHLVTASNILGRTKYYKQFPPDYLLDIQKRKEAHDAWKSKTYGQIQSEETLFTDDEEEIRLQ
tara:strand:- start:3933 stop:4529 length:597 start_codon:yes stop_codon:yes gene_type:complete